MQFVILRALPLQLLSLERLVLLRIALDILELQFVENALQVSHRLVLEKLFEDLSQVGQLFLHYFAGIAQGIIVLCLLIVLILTVVVVFLVILVLQYRMPHVRVEIVVIFFEHYQDLLDLLLLELKLLLVFVVSIHLFQLRNKQLDVFVE